MERCLLLLVILQVVLAQVPVPCTSPPQWQGRAVQIDRSKKFEVRSRISYDEIGQRVQYSEEVEIGAQRDYFDRLHLHQQRKSYVLNRRTRQCNITDITSEFHPFGIPSDAKFIDTLTIGLAGASLESLTVVNFALDRRGDRFFGSVTYPSCIPVYDTFYSNRTGFVETTFYDITRGISDPSIFIPPRECIQTFDKSRLPWQRLL